MEECWKFRHPTLPAEPSPISPIQRLGAVLSVAAITPPSRAAPPWRDEVHGLGIREAISPPWRTSDRTLTDKRSSCVSARPLTPALLGLLLDGGSTPSRWPFLPILAAVRPPRLPQPRRQPRRQPRLLRQRQRHLPRLRQRLLRLRLPLPPHLLQPLPQPPRLPQPLPPQPLPPSQQLRVHHQHPW